MELAKVVGTVVATRKDESLLGKKLLLVQPLDPYLAPLGNTRVMVDTAGAGVGEIVLFVTGAAARNAVRKREAAIDGAVVGIVDSVETDTSLLDRGEEVSR